MNAKNEISKYLLNIYNNQKEIDKIIIKIEKDYITNTDAQLVQENDLNNYYDIANPD